MKQFKRGFTLAEVLITITIIGVVAALTIPTLITNYQKQETIVKLKKIYAVMNQALKLSEIELVKKITENCGGLNETAVEKIGATARSIVELNSEGVTLALKTDKASVTRLEEIGEITTQLNGQLISSLNDISAFFL